MEDHAHDLDAELVAILERLAQLRMPFGKYGPERFPPRGIPLYDLPYEYLAWFNRHGFPRGELGTLLEFVYQAKADGADSMFDPLRKLSFGRTRLRPPIQRQFDLD